MAMYGLWLVFVALLIYRYVLPQTISWGRYPKGPLFLPVVGNLWVIFKLNIRPEKTCLALAERYGDICMLWYGTAPAVVINSPRAANELLCKVIPLFFNLISCDRGAL